MANIKTVQERNELHKAIWNIADELRGNHQKLQKSMQLIKAYSIYMKEIEVTFSINGILYYAVQQIFYTCQDLFLKNINFFLIFRCL